MSIQLDTETGGSRPPAVHLETEGNSITFGIVNIDPKVPMYEYGTGTPLVKHDGSPKYQTVVTGHVLKTDGATVGPQDDRRPAQPGDLVTIYIAGYAKYDPDQDKLEGSHVSWGSAIDKLRLTAGRPVSVGDVAQWKHLGELPSKGSFPRKNRKFAVRAPKDDETHVAACEQAYRDMQNPTAAATPFDDIEEPF